jgi:hypothetical protein
MKRLAVSRRPLLVLGSLTTTALLLAAPATAPLMAKDAATTIIAPATDPKSPVRYPEDFEAEIELTAQDVGGQTVKMKVFKLGTKQRVEMNAMGQDVVTLIDSTDKKATTLMPSQKLAMVMSSEGIPLDLTELQKEVTGASYKEVGKETIDGVDTVKYEVLDAKGAKRADLWTDPKTSYPVKFSSGKGDTVAWKKMVDTKPDAKLFVVPDDYQVMDMGKLDPNMLKGLMK